MATSISPAILRILEDPEHYAWSYQGFGMLRTYISRAVRLHIWLPQLAIESVSEIHDHPWDFESEVLIGCVLNELYETFIGTTVRRRFMRHMIKCGEGGGQCRAPEPVKLRKLAVLAYWHGESYKQTHDQIHRSVPIGGTVTLVHRSFHTDTEHANVYVPIGQEWVSAEPRPATRDEIEQFTTAALERLDDER